MRNVTEKIPGDDWRTNAAVLLNFCNTVVQSDCQKLLVAMAEYAATLQVDQDRKAA